MTDKTRKRAEIICLVTIAIFIVVTANLSRGLYQDGHDDGYDQGQEDCQAGNLSVLMNVSAYCPCERCCEKWADGITASGRPAKGFFIASPPNYPFGTLMVIPGYANGLPVPVWDRGGAIKGNKLDVFFPTHQEALNWGRQYLKVKILPEDD